MSKKMKYCGRLCSSMLLFAGVAVSYDLMADQKDAASKAGNNPTRLEHVGQVVTGSRADEVKKVHDKVLDAPGNIFRSPTYVVHEGGRKVIFAGEGNELDTLFNESLKDSKNKQ